MQPTEERGGNYSMNINEAHERYGVSTQAIYKKLKKRGIELREIKGADGHLTPEGEKLLDELFGHLVITGEGEAPAPERRKQDEASLLQAKAEIKRLQELVDGLQRETTYLEREVESLRNERDYLRRALDQAQQLHAMAIKMLPPPAEEKGGLFAKLAARFKKPSPPAEQTPPSSDNL